MSDEKKLMPANRFVLRPDDANDPAAVSILADDITSWVLAQRERVQNKLHSKRSSPDAAERWLESHPSELDRYRGQQIAVSADGIIASAPELSQLLAQLREKGIDKDDVLLSSVPDSL